MRRPVPLWKRTAVQVGLLLGLLLLSPLVIWLFALVGLRLGELLLPHAPPKPVTTALLLAGIAAQQVPYALLAALASWWLLRRPWDGLWSAAANCLLPTLLIGGISDPGGWRLAFMVVPVWVAAALLSRRERLRSALPAPNESLADLRL